MMFKTNHPVALIACLGLCLAVFAGCKNTDPVTPGQDTVLQYPNVVLDPALDDMLVRTQPITRPPTADQPVRIAVPVRSIVDHPLNLQYRVLYFDPFGKQTNDYPVWKDVRIMGRTRTVINDNAIDLDAVDWNIEIRPAR